MSKFAQDSSEGIYATVYADTIGDEGKCTRCGHAKETTEYAVRTCPAAKPWWDRRQHKLEEM